MGPRPTTDEMWGQHFMPPEIQLDILMPNGMLIVLDVRRESNLNQIKKDAWKEAKDKHSSLFSMLNEQSSYIFVAVTQAGKCEEFYDETRRLCDLKLFLPVMKLKKIEGMDEEKQLGHEISRAIGRHFNIPDNEEDKENQELVDCRRNYFTLVQGVVNEREELPPARKVLYAFPPELDEAYPHKAKREQDYYVWKAAGLEKIPFKVWIPGIEEPLDFEVGPRTKTEALIEEVLIAKQKRNQQSLIDYCDSDVKQWANEHKSEYTLKVCGKNQYLLGNYSLVRYKHVSFCISRKREIVLELIERNYLYNQMPKTNLLIPSFYRRAPQASLQQTDIYSSLHKYITTYKVEEYFKVYIRSAMRLNCKEFERIFVKTGIYQGIDPICPPKDTKSIDSRNPQWNECIEYDLYIPDIPRGAKLCLCLCAENTKKRVETVAIGWANISLFDYKHRLRMGRVNIALWPMPRGFDDYLYPYGIFGSNPDDMATCITIEFERYYSTAPLFPPDELLLAYKRISDGMELQNRLPKSAARPLEGSEGEDMEVVQRILSKDALYEMEEQEKDSLWRQREVCSHKYPNALPKLLQAVKWCAREESSRMYVLLGSWPTVDAETALELLDRKYGDPIIRKHAVHWLDDSLTGRDDLLAHYLLQLVQVLKFEPYIESDLSRFLLRRALSNRKIGHFVFWHLKAECYEPNSPNYHKVTLLLEAYCRGIGNELLQATIKQVMALEKLINLTDTLKERKEETQEKREKFLRDEIEMNFIDCLQEFHCPLNSSLYFDKLLLSECRIKDSAKRPFWLVWETLCPSFPSHSNKNAIIFKKGDDLRQDMLTLQVIKIMDLIWKRGGLDLKMLPYSVLATGHQVGLIEAIQKAKTVMNIQRSGGRMAAFQVQSKELHKWIKQHNHDQEDKDRSKHKYRTAIDTFTRSCAGYCVATFVLGIGDRNPDNIMVAENGQIFHIDFGHFLGHFKKKFGINRERVPFVLTEDFLHVIAKGADYPLKSEEFIKFKEFCVEAYKLLRKDANLLITLFTMMLSTGIPELQSMEDVEYLRRTLQLDKSEEEAVKFFGARFGEAHSGSFYTKIDWFFHSVAH